MQQKHLFVKSTVSLVLNFFLAISILCTIFLYGNRDSPRILSTLNETQVCIACNGPYVSCFQTGTVVNTVVAIVA
jgi:hypothetical protein